VNSSYTLYVERVPNVAIEGTRNYVQVENDNNSANQELVSSAKITQLTTAKLKKQIPGTSRLNVSCKDQQQHHNVRREKCSQRMRGKGAVRTFDRGRCCKCTQ
jgi:hypothetical protein